MGACGGKETNHVDDKKRGENEFDHLFKIVFVGDANVGKSSIVLRYVVDV